MERRQHYQIIVALAVFSGWGSLPVVNAQTNTPAFGYNFATANRLGCLRNVEQALSYAPLRAQANAGIQAQNRRRPRGQAPRPQIAGYAPVISNLPGRPQVFQLVVRSGTPPQNFKYQFSQDNQVLVVKDARNRIVTPGDPLPLTWDDALSVVLSQRISELTNVFQAAIPRFRPNLAFANTMSTVVGVPTEYASHERVPLSARFVGANSENEQHVTACNSASHFYTVCDAAASGGSISRLENVETRNNILRFVTPNSVRVSCALKGLVQLLQRRSGEGVDYSYSFALSNTPAVEPRENSDSDGSAGAF